MSNEITAQYFKYFHKADKKIVHSLSRRIGFTPDKEIFRGRIYGKNKVGSMIYLGRFRNKKAVLKIQFLKPAIDEADIINAFNKQNESKIIRLPFLYAAANWNKKEGYGYLLEEYVVGCPIYRPPLAKINEIKKFCRFYQEYKTKAVTKPMFPPTKVEQSALTLTLSRVRNWLKIAQAQQGRLKITEKYLREYYSIIKKRLPGIKIQFMHGHLTFDDICMTPERHFILMSNLFWSYRPEYYDATFNIWAGIKSITDLKISSQQIFDYSERWLGEYQKLPFIKNDPRSAEKFWLMMLERCVGALLIDIKNQHYDKNKKPHIKHLTGLFEELFVYCVSRL